MRVLVACEFSGIVRDAFAARGHDAWSCDLLPTERPGNHIQGDVLEVINEGWDLMIGHPPCTYLSNAGIRWFNEERYGDRARGRKQLRSDSMEFFMQLYNAPVAQVCVENPVGWPNSQFRSPDQIIEPFYFGDSEKKRTCLWLRNLRPLVHRKTATLFEMATHVPMPEPLLVQARRPGKYYAGGEIKKRYFCDGGSTRDGYERSVTFPGIANAMAEQWG